MSDPTLHAYFNVALCDRMKPFDRKYFGPNAQSQAFRFMFFVGIPVHTLTGEILI
jgi:hypothetical protein